VFGVVDIEHADLGGLEQPEDPLCDTRCASLPSPGTARICPRTARIIAPPTGPVKPVRGL
jgi:hypothetical protein